ncbi:MAG: AAA family ATPase [Sphingomonadales bacterium]|nr:AAA family ATPase [Sphingomonadales bacterium]
MTLCFPTLLTPRLIPARSGIPARPRPVWSKKAKAMTITQNSQPASPGTITLPTRTRLAMTSGEVLHRKAENVVRRANAVMAGINTGGAIAVRVRSGDKKPADAGWNRPGYVAPPADLASSNVGLRCGDCPAGCVTAVDVDVDDQATLEAVLNALGGLLNGMPLRHRSNSVRVLLLALASAGTSKVIWKLANGGKLELLANGQQAVVHGKHPSGTVLQWTWPDESEHDEPPPVNTLPMIAPQQIEDALVAAGIAFTGGVSKAAVPSGGAVQVQSPVTANTASKPVKQSSPIREAEIQWIVDEVAARDPNHFADHDGAFKGSMAIAGMVKRGQIDEPAARRQIERLYDKYRIYKIEGSEGETPDLINQAIRDARGDCGFGALAAPLLDNCRQMPHGWQALAEAAWVAAKNPTSQLNPNGVAGGQPAPNSAFVGGGSSNAIAPWVPARPANWQDAIAVAKGAELMLGGILIRGKATSVAAKSGIGKTHFAMLMLAQLAGDKDLMGLDDPANPRQPADALRVFGLFLEEELSLLGIKAKALAQHYGVTIDPDRVSFCGMECAEGLKFWSDGPNGRPMIDEGGFLGIDELASAHDVLIIDALGLVLENSTGTNDSTVAATTMKRLNKIASKHNCAILLVMHERKAKAGPDGRDADNVTGVAQWISHGRGNYTLSEMDSATAKNFGIDPDDAYRYLSAKSSKPNHAAKAEAIWFKKVGVTVSGEKHPVMVLERWKPPSVTAKAAGLATNAQAIALKVIDDAEKAGAPLYTASVKQAQNSGYPTYAIGEVAKALRATDPNATQGYAEKTAEAAILELEKQGKIVRKKGSNRRMVWSVV